MLGSNSSYIVMGEASESDEDDATALNLPIALGGIPHLIVHGEASESENEHCNVTTEAFRAKSEESLYNSLLHKKLRESNHKLKKDLQQLVSDNFKVVADQVSEMNQKLMCNQIEIQATIKYLKKSNIAMTKVENFMPYLLKQNFLPEIDIDI